MMKKDFFSPAYSSIPGAILTAVFGLILLIWPSLSSAVICYALSAGLLIFGIYRIITHFRKQPQSMPLQHDFASGVMLVAVALFILLEPDLIISLLPVLLGLLLIMGAARELQFMVDLKRLHEGRWVMALVAALIQVILGILILWNPFATAMVLMQFIGVSVLIESISQIVFTAIFSRSE